MNLSLQSFLVKPDASGRGYALDSHAPMKGRWTADIPMVMLAWAQLKIDSPVAFVFDVESRGLIVCRGKFLGQLNSGNSVAVLAGVFITNDEFEQIGWRTDLLAQSLPLADELSTFSQQPHFFEFSSVQPNGHPWVKFNLGWSRRFIGCDNSCDRLKVVSEVFDAVRPSVQLSRFRCWSTMSNLPPRGGFDVIREADLLLGAVGEQTPAGYERAELVKVQSDNGGFAYEFRTSEKATVPASYQTYLDMVELLKSITSQKQLADTFPWKPEYSDAAPSELAVSCATSVVGMLKLYEAYDLIRAMLDHENESVRFGGEATSRKVISRLIERVALDVEAIQLIDKQSNKDGTFNEIVMSGKLAKLDSSFLFELSNLVIECLHEARMSGTPVGKGATLLVVEWARLGREGFVPIESAFDLVRALRGDDSIRGVGDVFTPYSVNLTAGTSDVDMLPRATKSLMDDEFFSPNTFCDINHAVGRISAALTALIALGGQHGQGN